jgi:hypothetical protein
MCLSALNTLLNLLSSLGFLVSWSKVEGHSQRITFLGIEIDSMRMELLLSNTKLCEFKGELAKLRQRVRASKKQLQSLAGKRNWASAVVHGGRVFLRRIINSFSGLKQDWHNMRIQGDLLADLYWWHNVMSPFNEKSLILNNNHITYIATDACKEGGGGLHALDWFYVNWGQEFPCSKEFYTDELEAFAVILAAKRWAKDWQNRRVVVLCDNTTTVACINKCTSRNKNLTGFLRELFWLSASYKAVHVPGTSNVLADAISRLHEPRCFEFFMQFCLPQPIFVPFLFHHSHVS